MYASVRGHNSVYTINTNNNQKKNFLKGDEKIYGNQYRI